jgi:hypothetical protein
VAPQAGGRILVRLAPILYAVRETGDAEGGVRKPEVPRSSRAADRPEAGSL